VSGAGTTLLWSIEPCACLAGREGRRDGVIAGRTHGGRKVRSPSPFVTGSGSTGLGPSTPSIHFAHPEESVRLFDCAPAQACMRGLWPPSLQAPSVPLSHAIKPCSAAPPSSYAMHLVSSIDPWPLPLSLSLSGVLS
jgi:hypothetical protein